MAKDGLTLYTGLGIYFPARCNVRDVLSGLYWADFTDRAVIRPKFKVHQEFVSLATVAVRGDHTWQETTRRIWQWGWDTSSCPWFAIKLPTPCPVGWAWNNIQRPTREFPHGRVTVKDGYLKFWQEEHGHAG